MIPINNVLYGINSEKIDLYEGLVAFFDFDDDTIDSHNLHSGLGNGNLTYSNGVINNCFRKYYNTWITIENHTDFQFSNGLEDIPFSFSFWFTKADSVYRSIINKYGVSFKEWSIGISGQSYGPAELNLYSDENNYVKFSADLNFGVEGTMQNNIFYHFAFTWDGTNCKIYRNAILHPTQRFEVGVYSGINNSIQPLYIGRLGDNTLNEGTMNIDGLTIWKNKVLNQAEINALYNNGQGLAYPF